MHLEQRNDWRLALEVARSAPLTGVTVLKSETAIALNRELDQLLAENARLQANYNGCADTCSALHKEVERLRLCLQHVASVAHNGGLVGLSPENARLVAEFLKLDNEEE